MERGRSSRWQPGSAHSRSVETSELAGLMVSSSARARRRPHLLLFTSLSTAESARVLERSPSEGHLLARCREVSPPLLSQVLLARLERLQCPTSFKDRLAGLLAEQQEPQPPLRWGRTRGRGFAGGAGGRSACWPAPAGGAPEGLGRGLQRSPRGRSAAPRRSWFAAGRPAAPRSSAGRRLRGRQSFATWLLNEARRKSTAFKKDPSSLPVCGSLCVGELTCLRFLKMRHDST